MLESDQDMIIEGLKYADIEQDATQKLYLQSLRANLPQYSNMSSQQKSWYFRNLSKDYETCMQAIDKDDHQVNINKKVSFEDI